MGLQAALDFRQLFFHTSRSPRPLTTNTGCTGTKLVPIRPCIPNLCFANKWLVSSLSYLTWLTTPAMSTTFYIHFTTLTTSLDDSDNSLVFAVFCFFSVLLLFFLFSRGSRIQKSVKRIFDENRNTQPLIVVQDTDARVVSSEVSKNPTWKTPVKNIKNCQNWDQKIQKSHV